MNSVSDAYRRGDVFWAPDPFGQGSNPRLWLVLVAEQLPYPGEEYVCAALTTSDLPANYEVGDAWLKGRNPRYDVVLFSVGGWNGQTPGSSESTGTYHTDVHRPHTRAVQNSS